MNANVTSLNTHREIENPFDAMDGVDFPVATRPIAMVGREETAPIYSHKAVVRMLGDRPQCLGVVGEKYEVVTHLGHFRAVEQGLLQGLKPAHLEGAYVHTKTAGFGAWARRDYIFPAVSERIEAHGMNISDKIGYACFAWNSYDGSSSVAALLGLLAFYCTNGMYSMDYDAKKLRRHTSGLVIEEFTDLVSTGITRFYRQVELFQAWARLSVNEEQAEAFFKKVFGTSKLKQGRMLEQFRDEVRTRGDNLWALYNALTQYSSHSDDRFPVRRTGTDHEARTLTNRESEVHRIVSGRTWQDFEQSLAA